MARALLADPELPNKASTQRSSFINTCIACNQACLDNAFRNQPTTCILNPEAGREIEMTLKPAAFNKKVAVIGAGPAGLEASRVLAMRGHNVTLFEKQTKIGGQLLYAIQVPGKQEFLNTIRFYENSLNELGVQIELNSDVAAQELKTFDAIVVATGAKPYIPEIQGAEHQTSLNYDQFFAGDINVKDRVVIIGSGGIGCDIAHILSDASHLYPPESFFDKTSNVKNYEQYIQSLPQNRTITLTRRGKRIGERLGPTTRWALIQLLENRGVQMMTQISYEKITEEGLQIKTRIGKEVLLPANTIIFATGQVPDSTLYNLLTKETEKCYQIGSCRIASEANAQTAIWEGAEVARMI